MLLLLKPTSAQQLEFRLSPVNTVIKTIIYIFITPVIYIIINTLIIINLLN